MAKTPPPQAPDDDDAALFRDAIGPVRALPVAPAPPPKPKPRPAARMAERDEADARSEFRRALADHDAIEAGDVLSYRRETVPPRTLQRLRKGLYAVQDELDLHHADAAQAEKMLRTFLAEAHAHDAGCVRIIHGKGRHGDSALPVLKNLVDRVLRHRADVLAFHSAPPAQGGTGAVLVLLARR
jgi:DNA-nicking Smr family endonuclease